MRDHQRLCCIGSNVDNFTAFPQGCSFSPDGLCVLTSSNNELRLYNTPFHPQQDQEHHDENQNSSSLPLPIQTALKINGGDTVRSYDWYPFMKSSDPTTCCFLATSRDQPVHLYDAYNGRIRATYCPYSEKDEMESPMVVAFQPDGQRLVCGGGFRNNDRCLHVFDVNRPGKDGALAKLGKTRRSSDGQKGHVSSLAFSPSSAVLAVGTYSPGSIYLYDNRMEREAGSILSGVCLVGHGKSHARKKRRFDSLMITDEDEMREEEDKDVFSAAKVKWYHGRARTGVTQIQFAPNNDGHRLYSTSRRSDAIIAWDVRMMTDPAAARPMCGVQNYETRNDTNQRIEFDLSECGRFLYTGGNDCSIRTYDTATGELLHQEKGLSDVANGISYHDVQGGMLAVAMGTRHFPDDDDDDDDDDTNDQKEQQALSVQGSLHVFKVHSQKHHQEDRAAAALDSVG